jgi:hypothetical protein
MNTEDTPNPSADITEIKELSTSIGKEAMTTWTDKRRDDFVNTFNERVAASKSITATTNHRLWLWASERHLVSRADAGPRYTPFSCHTSSRSDQEIEKIAKARLEEIIKDIPGTRQLISIIDKETGKLMDKRDLIQKQIQGLTVQLEEISQDIDIEDIDQNMSVGTFRKMVTDRVKKHDQLSRTFARLAKEGHELTVTIDKKLYKGLPGIRETINTIVKNQDDRVEGLNQMLRRVTEQVKFGDSVTAMKMLETFEKDEIHISEEWTNKLRLAVDNLRKPQAKKIATKKT